MRSVLVLSFLIIAFGDVAVWQIRIPTIDEVNDELNKKREQVENEVNGIVDKGKEIATDVGQEVSQATQELENAGKTAAQGLNDLARKAAEDSYRNLAKSANDLVVHHSDFD